ncbi:dynamin family protein [Stutzerimonas stutzeri]|uniref:dynamin family protein n=1 Tax=Stutzerimonas stutzeri TaxID=316 RepID=UPI0018D8C494|nr:dynamin family protein [Stutzerimonas stutzeri]MDI9727869.1 dynamin family protein [Stutzerimonas stutzeri]MDI9747531.1 dynamin family protein [Stutzerimonas stutzeri]QPT28533.1 dynamin family protein [Stutzerimonas stutzeri]
MLDTQKALLDYLNSLAQVIENVRTAELDINGEPAQTQAFAQAVAERELLVPVVGAFSAGKSSLLNAIIGSSILPMDIKPETAIPTELRHDAQERLEALFADGRTERFGIEQLPALQERAEELQLLRLYINRPALKGLAPLVLVDMPGFNSPLDAHNKAIAHYIGEGAHYLFVVSVEEGSLHKQILRNMDEVTLMGRNFSVCVNKADLKPVADVQGICDYISEQLEDEGFPATVCAVSKNDISSVNAMLGSFNPEALFGSIFQPELLQQNFAIESTLCTALDGLNSDKESNEQKIAEIEDALRALEKEREQQTQANSAGNLERIVDEVLRSVHTRLAGSVDEMARAALRSQDEMTRIISDEVRSGLTVGLKRATDSMSAHMVNEFSQHVSGSLRPELHLTQSNWTDSLLQTLQTQLLPGLLSAIGGQAGGAASALLTTVPGLAAARLIPNPIVQVVVTILPSLLGALFGRISEGQKLEQAKDAIRTQVLPDVERGLRPEISSFLLQAQEEIVRAVSDAFDQQIKAQKDILEKINQQAESGNLEARIRVLEEALAEVRALAHAHLQAAKQ